MKNLFIQKGYFIFLILMAIQMQDLHNWFDWVCMFGFGFAYALYRYEDRQEMKSKK